MWDALLLAAQKRSLIKTIDPFSWIKFGERISNLIVEEYAKMLSFREKTNFFDFFSNLTTGQF
jgi:hypothetical protein